MKILKMQCIRGACLIAFLGCSLEVLEGSCIKVLSGPRSSRSFYDDFLKFSYRSWYEDLDHNHAEALDRRDTLEDPCMKISKILKMPCMRGACMKAPLGCS